MGLREYAQTAEYDIFQKKIKVLMQKSAIAIMAEAADTASHTERVVYAKKILSGEASVSEYSYGVVTNSTIQGKIDNSTSYDSDLEFVVNSMVNAFAGVALVSA